MSGVWHQGVGRQTRLLHRREWLAGSRRWASVSLGRPQVVVKELLHIGDGTRRNQLRVRPPVLHLGRPLWRGFRASEGGLAASNSIGMGFVGVAVFRFPAAVPGIRGNVCSCATARTPSVFITIAGDSPARRAHARRSATTKLVSVEHGVFTNDDEVVSQLLHLHIDPCDNLSKGVEHTAIPMMGLHQGVQCVGHITAIRAKLGMGRQSRWPKYRVRVFGGDRSRNPRMPSPRPICRHCGNAEVPISHGSWKTMGMACVVTHSV